MLQTSFSPLSSNWTAPTSRTSSTRWTIQNFLAKFDNGNLAIFDNRFLAEFDGSIPPSENGEWWPRLSRCPDMTLPWHTSPPAGEYFLLTFNFNNPLSGWTQARYARSHSVEFGESVDYLHCTNSAILTKFVSCSEIYFYSSKRHVKTTI